MYPNLYYAFKDWFGVEWNGLSFLNTFGLMVAMGFVTAAIVLSKELQRKEKLGLLTPREEMIVVGKPATWSELLINGFVGFLFGYKILGFFFYHYSICKIWGLRQNKQTIQAFSIHS